MSAYVIGAVAALWIAAIVLVWTRGGLGKGRRFGNKLAKRLRMSNSFFHTVLENGVSGSSLSVLAMLEGVGLTPEQACIELAPSLNRGLIALEKRFGQQQMIDTAKPTVAELLDKWGQLQEQRGQQ